ncbi:S-layer homology domain-containing protein [Jeotgalibacillus terrae]|uniref:S-layer homology domain-containing protein n=1 Tax=Jeotgalibacillus terrae TaxID=587735 RepID=A0ABW5ZE71_9BACL|nr:S-layer homology domain-containing protein [Jeotgalibacillus terrae]MBM7577792.1 lysophospholipase L1-like esterase [Jeotgalibacillus terrae]
MKKLMSALISLTVLFAVFLPGAGAHTLEEPITYIPLGDSYAAGINDQRMPDVGYTDYIAQDLEKRGKLAEYTKEFTRSGFDSVELLEDLKTNQELRQQLSEADLITLSAGGNDLLGILNINEETGELSFDSQEITRVYFALNNRLKMLHEEINAINPDADVYAFGYAFPLPALDPVQKEAFYDTFEFLNNTIERQVIQAGGKYIDIDTVFGRDAFQWFPNQFDIHPNTIGYRVMANEFIDTYHHPLMFSDVSSTHWAKEYIDGLSKRLIVTGDEEGKFNPNGQLTRADAAQALYNVLYLDEVQADVPNPGYSDVPVSHPNYDAIAALADLGIFVKAEKFNPDNSLSRAQMAKIFDMTFDLPEGEPKSFTDLQGNYAWAAPHVDALSSAGYVSGYDDGTFRPNQFMSKAQIAKILQLMLEDRKY